MLGGCPKPAPGFWLSPCVTGPRDGHTRHPVQSRRGSDVGDGDLLVTA